MCTETLETCLHVLSVLPAMPLVDFGEDMANAQDFFRVDGNVGCLPRGAARWFCKEMSIHASDFTHGDNSVGSLTMDHDARVREAMSFALLT